VLREVRDVDVFVQAFADRSGDENLHRLLRDVREHAAAVIARPRIERVVARRFRRPGWSWDRQKSGNQVRVRAS
jgi:hypothetical protein